MVDLNDLPRLIKLLEQSDLQSLELSGPDGRIRLVVSSEDHSVSVNAERAAGADAASAESGALGRVAVYADSAGIFMSGHPMRAAPFAAVGDAVRANDIVGMLKVSHLYAPVRAPVDGVISEILAVDGALLGYGAPILAIDPTAAAAGE